MFVLCIFCALDVNALRMLARVCMCMYVCMRVFACAGPIIILMLARVCAHFVCLLVCVSMRVFVCAFVCVILCDCVCFFCVCVCMCIYVFVFVWFCVCVCVYALQKNALNSVFIIEAHPRASQ